MPDELSEYDRKRDFSKTNEPKGAKPRARRAKKPRFVIQEHHARRLHWDLRLERDGVAVSFAIPNGIPFDPKDNRLAVRTEDHPLEYLEFEGDIPAGEYGAGTMRIWDRGTFSVEKWDPKKIEVTLRGERVSGRYALFVLKDADWMIHRMDPSDDPERVPMPEHVVPMLAKLGALPPERDAERWAFEVKWDGVRAVAYSQPGRLRLESRNLNDITAGYPELRALNRALSHHEAVLDGEIVAFDDAGRPSFEHLQQRMHVRGERQVKRLMESVPVVYVIFDLLYLDGRDLMRLPYCERRERLAALELLGTHWRVPAHHVGNGAALLEAARENGLEGVIAKRLDCPYEPGRRGGGWIKIKNVERDEFVIGAWLPGEGRRRERIGSLAVGQWVDGELRYAGNVGTGFTESELDRLAKILGPLERPDSPFTGKQPGKGAVWLEPGRAAHVEYLERTGAGAIRAPSYKGLVEVEETDRLPPPPLHPGEVDVDGRAIKLTNLDKVLYPETGFTKGQVIDYYARIAPVLVPHLDDRPLTLKRYPNGVEDKFFFEKNCPKHAPEWIPRARYESRRSGNVDFCVCKERATLVWLGQMAALELHPQLHRAPAIGMPTALVFDLDPGPPATIVQCCEVGLLLQGMFEQLGLQAFAKTSGSKGLQVYVPLNHDGATYDQTKSFAKAVADTLAGGRPELVVAKMSKDLRPGKVFIDWSQNDQVKTTVSVYSLRARERPTVSTPVTWEEVAGCADSGDPGRLVFEAPDVLERVAEQGDLFAGVLSVTQVLPG